MNQRLLSTCKFLRSESTATGKISSGYTILKLKSIHLMKLEHLWVQPYWGGTRLVDDRPCPRGLLRSRHVCRNMAPHWTCAFGSIYCTAVHKHAHMRTHARAHTHTHTHTPDSSFSASWYRSHCKVSKMQQMKQHTMEEEIIVFNR